MPTAVRPHQVPTTSGVKRRTKLTPALFHLGRRSREASFPCSGIHSGVKPNPHSP